MKKFKHVEGMAPQGDGWVNSENLTWNSEIEKRAKKKLNLGCGLTPEDGYINIDNRPETRPDMCVDITMGLPFEDDSVDIVRTFDLLEHIAPKDIIPLMNEIYRVLRHGGKLEVRVPSTDGRAAFMDPHHISFWNANSFFYYIDDNFRALYGIKAKFAIGLIQNLNMSQPENKIIHAFAILFAVKDEK